MTVSVLRNQVQYTGNNSTTAFTVNFPYTEKSQIKVYLAGVLQTITTHYTLTDPDSTGTVTFGTAPGTGVVITILRETDFLQTVDYANNDILDAETLESAFDKLTMMCQQVKGLVDKSVGFDETVSEAETTSLKLASGTGDLAGKLLAFDDSGNFVTTQEIGTFRGNDTTTTTAAYVVRDLIRDSSNDNVYFTKVDAPAGTLLTNTTYFELLVDVETVRGLKVDAETARTGAETAETNAEAALASFQGQYKTGGSNPYTGTPDQGDLWYDTSASILKYYSGSSFEPVTTSLATVTGNYLTISNQVITAGTVPVSLGGTGSTNAADARTALGVDPAGTDNSTDVTLAGSLDYLTISGQAITRNAIDLTTDVTGALPVANGGTGSNTASGARTALGVDPAGTDNSTDVTLATVTGNYLSLSGQQITAGTVPVTLGGTGSTTASDARTALGVDPAGTDNSTDVTLAAVTGNYLTLSGQQITAGTVPVSLGGTGSTTASDARTALGVDPSGTDNSTNVTLAAVTSNYLTISGQEITAGTVPVSLGGTGSTTASDARTALGVDPAGTDNSTNVTLVTTSHDYLSLSSQAITLGAIDLTADVTGTLPVGNGGTGLTALGTAGQVLKVNSGATALEFADEASGGGGSGTSYIEHSSTVSDSLAISAGTNRMYVGNTTFSGSGDMEGYLVISHGFANFTSASALNITSTGTLNIVG